MGEIEVVKSFKTYPLLYSYTIQYLRVLQENQNFQESQGVQRYPERGSKSISREIETQGVVTLTVSVEKVKHRVL